MATPDQIRAARALLGKSQPDVAVAAGVSTMTLKRAEGSGQPPASLEAVAAIRAALETAGVEFIAENGGGAGVRLRKAAHAAHSDADLDLKIADYENAIAEMSEPPEPSPQSALAKMDKAMAENELVKMKNARARRKSTSRKA